MEVTRGNSRPEETADSRFLALKSGAFDTFLHHSDMGVAILDSDLCYRAINATLAQFNGVSVEGHIGRSVSEILPKLAPIVVPALQAVLTTGESLVDIEIKGETPSTLGRIGVWKASYLPINDDSGNTVGILAIAVNRTIEHELAQAKKESDELVRRVLDGLFTFVGMLTPDGTVIDVNKSPLEAAGISVDDVRGNKFWDCYWWNYDPDIQQQLRDALESARAGNVVRYDVVVRMAGDSRMTIDFMLSPLRNAQGEITHLIPSGNDVSARVVSEQKLRYSEERFRRVVESTADGLIMIDENGSILLANSRAASMFGYSKKEFYQLTIESLVPDSIRDHHSALREGYQAAPQARGMASMQELYAKTKKGDLFPVEIGLTPLTFEGGTRILATVMDITIQKDIQKNLIRALTEKTSLLNEVHHRVKNNLQVVSSLLSLQARSVPEEAKIHFEESQSRIKAMALIHQLLYEQKNFDRVESVAYLQRLSDLLRRSYSNAFHRITMTVESNNESCFLSLEHALPFGLLVNELVTNAVKHAFVGRDSGHINLVMERKGDNAILTVSDDGVGLPDGCRPGTGGSLGFRLIPGLVDQMDGVLEVLNTSGTGFRLMLKLAGDSE
ncbi:MAG: PAS domain-containing protein [Thalassolituus sp.]|uniref:PAS domain-containing protein n=1 Tax=Thalassolituus sp. TaxID=2030822 RepID=UPI0039822255